MKMRFMLKVAFLLAQTLILSGSLQADSSKEVSNADKQVGEELSPTEFSGKQRQKCREKPKEPPQIEPRRTKLEHLYAFNTSATGGTLVSRGEDVPFNNGTGVFPPRPVVKGKGIHQLNITDFIIIENGDYQVTFYGYTSPASFNGGTGVQLFVNTVPTGPQSILSNPGDTLAFSQIIRISGASQPHPALIEVKAIVLVSGNLVLESAFPGGIDATLEIIKLSEH